MLQKDIRSTVKPSAILIEEYGEEKHVYLHDNIRTEKDEDGQEMYVYDGVSFELEPGRTETEKDIKKNFDQWWAYGAQPNTAEPTLEERVAALEDYLLEA